MNSKMNDKISASELDDLLGKAFVNQNWDDVQGEKIMEAVSGKVLRTTPAAGVIKFWIIGLSVVAAAFLVIAGLSLSADTTQPENAVPAKAAPLAASASAPAQRTATHVPEDSRTSKTGAQPPAPKPARRNKKSVAVNTAPEITQELPGNGNDQAARPEQGTSSDQFADTVVKGEPAGADITFVLPALSDREKKRNEREKKKLARLAAHIDDKRYTPVTGLGSGEELYFANGEITNLEYRTFLIDLIIQGEREKYLVARPKHKLWRGAGGVHQFDTLQSVYFMDRRFDYRPVVNISPEGAELYAIWLADQANGIRKKDGSEVVTVRLPSEKEWLHAARAGKQDAVFPWGSDSIQNADNSFLANFCIRKLADKFSRPFKYEATDTTAFNSAAFVSRDKWMCTVEYYAYNPNDFGLYCMSGNVSELVTTESGKFKSKGGNWASDFYHLRLDREDELNFDTRPSPLLGFRVCIVHHPRR